MIALLLVRHAPTAWNRAGRVHGRVDVELADAGVARARGWRLPAGFDDARVVASPLKRACQTAAILAAGREVTIEPRLTEMDWGAWEGLTLASARAADPDGAARNEARGLDFRPPGGESPREVTVRLAGFLRDLATDRRAAIAVTHKGILRAALFLATGWDMRAKPPIRLGVGDALRLDVAPSGAPSHPRLLPLDGTPARLPA